MGSVSSVSTYEDAFSTAGGPFVPAGLEVPLCEAGSRSCPATGLVGSE